MSFNIKIPKYHSKEIKDNNDLQVTNFDIENTYETSMNSACPVKEEVS